MSGFSFLSAGARAVSTALLLTFLFAAGVAAGLYFYPQVFSVSAGLVQHDLHDDDHPDELPDEDHADSDEADHVALTPQAFANLNLRLGTVTTGDYWKTTVVPARVVEIPGQSELSVSAPVTGIIESVHVVPGQALSTDGMLFVIRLSDEAMLTAESRYLESLTRQQVVQEELARLAPLAESGAVSGTRGRELEYELKQLQAQQKTLQQELRARGLPEALLNQLRQQKVLASTLTVPAPDFTNPDSETARPARFFVEQLMVHPGMTVSRGEPLCTVACHRDLYLEGTAFEGDLPVLEAIHRKSWPVTAEHQDGPVLNADGSPVQLKLLRVDNHVDEETQTVRFYVQLPNEIAQSLTADNRQFDQWRFRPGQRMHLRLPVDYWQDQWMLPTEAVVIDGPQVFVFAEHHHDPHTDEPPPPPKRTTSFTLAGTTSVTPAEQDPHDDLIEFEPVSLRLLHRDSRTVVIANDGQLTADTQIALNQAYKLYLEMKMQAGTGAGHHHHDH